MASNLADTIFEDLQAQVLSGRLPAGSRLRSERELAPEYDTNRNTLREALRKLEHAGLVRFRQGQGGTVADFRRSGTIEILGAFLEHCPDATERLGAIRDILEARTRTLEMAVAMAAERARPEDVARLTALAQSQAEAHEAGDRRALVEGDIETIEAIVEAAHSLPVRWIANTLLAPVRTMGERLPAMWLFDATYPTHLAALARAIGARASSEATDEIRRYYDSVDARVIPFIEAALQASAEATPPSPEHDHEVTP